MSRETRGYPSPVLADEQVREILVDWVGMFSAARVLGCGRTLPVPFSAEAKATVEETLKHVFVPPEDSEPIGEDRGVVVGLIGSGFLSLNAAVIQIDWHPDRAEVTAHALEGLIRQRTSSKALAKIESALLPFARGG